MSISLCMVNEKHVIKKTMSWLEVILQICTQLATVVSIDNDCRIRWLAFGDSQVRITVPISFVVLLYIIYANEKIILKTLPWLLHFMYIHTTVTPMKKDKCIAYRSNMCGWGSSFKHTTKHNRHENTVKGKGKRRCKSAYFGEDVPVCYVTV